MSKSSKKHPRQIKQTHARKLNLWLVLALAIVIIGVSVVVVVSVNNAAKQHVSSDSAANSYPLELSAKDVVASQATGAFILDVRTQAEWTEVHIAGSVLIPLDTLADHLNDLPRDKYIIVVCRSGVRSSQGRDILRKAGFTRVSSLSGGLINWMTQGYPTVSGQS